MEERIKVNIDDYISLYNCGLKLDQIKPLKNQTYRLFRESNLDIRIIHRKETYKNSTAFGKIRYFVKDNDYFYMIPVTTVKGTIVGFILRGVTKKKYNTVSRDFSDYSKKVPLMFGFDKRFKSFEKHDTCYPIVICEGSKDCIFLKRFYPYVVAINRSSLGINAQVLTNISNKFVLAYDNDKSGQDGIERDKKILRSLGAQVVSLDLSSQVKDCCDYLDHPDQLENFKKELKYKLKRVMSF